jgi:hypothetical protein
MPVAHCCSERVWQPAGQVPLMCALEQCRTAQCARIMHAVVLRGKHNMIYGSSGCSSHRRSIIIVAATLDDCSELLACSGGGGERAAPHGVSQ